MPMLVYGGHMFQWADHLHNHPPVTRYLLCFFFNHYFKIPLKFLMHILLFSYFFKLVFLRLNSQDVISVSNMTLKKSSCFELPTCFKKSWSVHMYECIDLTMTDLLWVLIIIFILFYFFKFYFIFWGLNYLI